MTNKFKPGQRLRHVGRQSGEVSECTVVKHVDGPRWLVDFGEPWHKCTEHEADLSALPEEPAPAFSASLLGQVEVKREPVTKKTVLETALQTVADRGVPYGGVEDNFRRIANLWNAHLENRFTEFAPHLEAADVAMMMILMKIARLAHAPSHADSWVDVAGYAACGGEIGAKLTVDK